MSLYLLSSSNTSSSFTSLMEVAAVGGERERQRHYNDHISSYRWRRTRLLSYMDHMMRNMNESHFYRWHRCKAFQPLFVNCSSSSDSNSNSSRGFGSTLSPQFDTDSNNNNTTKKKKKNNKLNDTNSSSNSLLAPGLSTSRGGRGIDSPSKLRTTTPSSDLQFEQRLQAVKRSALEKKKIGQNTQYAAIDYDQPPEAPNSTSTDTPKAVGLGTKIGIGVAVVVFGFVFALGDFLPTSSVIPSEESTVVDSKISEEERKNLKTRLQQFETALTATPKDPATVEGAAVTLAELGEFSRASSLLEELTKMKPNDTDAFRLLGEVKYQLKDYQGSAAAYTRSAMVSKKINFEVLRGLTNSLLAAKRPDEAVQFLLVSRDQLNANSLEADEDAVDPIQVELLLGKAYSDWGHVSDAVSVYDQLISTHPDDFRGYLAKGIILKENGRAGDAERMFMQARFFAPEKARALVDRFARK